MMRKRFESWLENINNTQADEISCSECFDLVSKFVDLELSNGKPEGSMPQVIQHLNQCPACREEYETLRDLRRLDDENDGPSVDGLPKIIS